VPLTAAAFVVLATPVALIISAVALIGWLVGSWVLAGEPDVRRAVFAGLGVLVMGYPCAVGIAAPLAIVRAAGEAADLGIIMRGVDALSGLFEGGVHLG